MKVNYLQNTLVSTLLVYGIKKVVHITLTLGQGYGYKIKANHSI